MRTSRQAWPSPIGEVTISARRTREGARVQRGAGCGPPLQRAAKSRIRRLMRTGSRACGEWQLPAKDTN